LMQGLPRLEPLNHELKSGDGFLILNTAFVAIKEVKVGQQY